MHSGWTDDNLWWLVLAGAAWLVQRVKAAQKKAERTRPGAGARPAPDGEAERMRRVQDEIRRRIEERRSGRLPPPRQSPAPAAPPTPRPRWPRPPDAQPRDAPPPAQPAAPAAPDDIPSLFEPPALADSGEPSAAAAAGADILAGKIRAQEASEAVALVRQQFVDLGATDLTEEALAAEPAPTVDIATELREPASARRAVVLREILGPPVGFR
ncbi:MAG: hypothetical protein ACREFX_13835 [Opitutaceae bacterium]